MTAQSDTDLERRLQTLEDRGAVAALVMEYRRALDAKDFPAYAKLFGADGEFVSGSSTRKGEADILDMLNGMRGVNLTENEGDDRHVVVNTTIEVDGDTASARSYWIYFLRDEAGKPHLDQVGHYWDVYVRDNGTWRFARRDAGRELPPSSRSGR